MGDRLTVRDGGETLAFTFADLLRYHGPGSPGGVALAFKALERGLPLLAAGGLAERREILVETAFAGPGARDAFELVLRAVSGDRYVVDPGLERDDLPRTRGRFLFRLTWGGRTATMIVREGFVSEEFVELAGRGERSARQEDRLRALKTELAGRVIAAPADAVFDADPGVSPRARRA
jgi:hypothetical protein